MAKQIATLKAWAGGARGEWGGCGGEGHRGDMQHTRRCTRHRGLPMPECPSQWGCPAKSLGMSALICFYTQRGVGGRGLERCTWSLREMSVRETQRRQYTQHVNSRHDVASTWRMMVVVVVLEGRGGEEGLWGGGDGAEESVCGNYFYWGVRHRTSTCVAWPSLGTLPYLVLYEPCPSLQASCSSLINIRVFWLLRGRDWKKTWHHNMHRLLRFLIKNNLAWVTMVYTRCATVKRRCLRAAVCKRVAMSSHAIRFLFMKASFRKGMQQQCHGECWHAAGRLNTFSETREKPCVWSLIHVRLSKLEQGSLVPVCIKRSLLMYELAQTRKKQIILHKVVVKGDINWMMLCVICVNTIWLNFPWKELKK